MSIAGRSSANTMSKTSTFATGGSWLTPDLLGSLSMTTPRICSPRPLPPKKKTENAHKTQRLLQDVPQCAGGLRARVTNITSTSTQSIPETVTKSPTIMVCCVFFSSCRTVHRSERRSLTFWSSAPWDKTWTRTKFACAETTLPEHVSSAIWSGSHQTRQKDLETSRHSVPIH